MEDARAVLGITTESCGRRAEHRRLSVALGASALIHAWLLAASPQLPQQLPTRSVTITARVEVEKTGKELALPDDSAEFVTLANAPQISGPASFPRAKPTTVRKQHTAPEAVVTREGNPAQLEAHGTAAFPHPADPTWYSAHELDSYPRALAPLQFDPRAAGLVPASTRLLLWLRIDEQGRLVEITAGETGIPAELVQAARASLAAISFTPARKDERAVKSRLLLSVSFAQAVNDER